MERAAGLIKLKPGTSKDVDEWCETMKAQRKEFTHALQDEGVRLESWFRLDIEEGSYLLWFMEADSIGRAVEVFLKSQRPIDVYHAKTMSEIADTQIEADPLLHMSSDDGVESV